MNSITFGRVITIPLKDLAYALNSQLSPAEIQEFLIEMSERYGTAAAGCQHCSSATPHTQKACGVDEDGHEAVAA